MEKVQSTKNPIGILSGNMLKLLACFTMLCDHAGFLVFPSYYFPKLAFLRIVGRLAFPIFCFFLAEGCYYTKNRKKHFLTIAGFAAVIQIGYYIGMRDITFSVFVIFTCSVALIYLLDGFIPLLFEFSQLNKRQKTIAFACLFGFFALSAFLYWGCEQNLKLASAFAANYGLIGIYTPVGCYVVKRFGGKFYLPISCLILGGFMILICVLDGAKTQYYSLLSLPLLMLYSGKRGSAKLKYFFYFFYPLHMLALEGVFLLLEKLGFYR